MCLGKKSAQIREILISESAWEEMTCLFAPSLAESGQRKGGRLNLPPISHLLAKGIPVTRSLRTCNIPVFPSAITAFLATTSFILKEKSSMAQSIRIRSSRARFLRASKLPILHHPMCLPPIPVRKGHFCVHPGTHCTPCAFPEICHPSRMFPNPAQPCVNDYFTLL